MQWDEIRKCHLGNTEFAVGLMWCWCFLLLKGKENATQSICRAVKKSVDQAHVFCVRLEGPKRQRNQIPHGMTNVMFILDCTFVVVVCFNEDFCTQIRVYWFSKAPDGVDSLEVKQRTAENGSNLSCTERHCWTRTESDTQRESPNVKYARRKTRRNMVDKRNVRVAALP